MNEDMFENWASLPSLAEADTAEIAEAARAVLDAKKATDIAVIPVAGQSDITDCLVLATGNAGPHVKALAAEVEYRLESAASQMRVLENQVSYSTIHLNLEEVRVYTEEDPETFGQRISRSFKSSLESIGEFFTDLAVFLAGNLPVILCWAAVIVLTILGIRKITRKNRKKASAAPIIPLSEPPENPPFKQP